jgi:predicted ester cyclase
VGEFCGVPPTGRVVTATGIVIWRIDRGRVVEDRNTFDRWAVVSQIDPVMTHARAG